jgi:nicotinamidase-related amidase
MKSALLIIDLQRGFINQDTCKIVDVVNSAKNYLDYDLCIYTEFYNNDDSSFSRILNWYEFQSEKEREIVIPIQRGELIMSKNTYSAINEDLKCILNTGYDKVYVCGVDTEACVLATAYDLFDMGIKPLIIIDACASSGGVSYHSAAALIMRRSFGNDSVNNLSCFLKNNK